MPGLKGSQHADSPTAIADQDEPTKVQDDQAAQAIDFLSADPSPAKAKEAAPPAEKGPEEPKAETPKEKPAPSTDPLTLAIDKLSLPEPTPKAKTPAKVETPSAKPAKAEKPKQVEPEVVKLDPALEAEAKAKAKAAKPEPTADDPYDGFSDHERSFMKEKTKHRITSLYERARAAETKLTEREQSFEAEKDHLEAGRLFNKVLDDHHARSDLIDVDDDSIAGAIGAAAAANRLVRAFHEGTAPSDKDWSAVEIIQSNLDGLYKAFGKTRAAEAASPAAFTGELPNDLKNRVDVELTEDEARAIAAARQSKAAAKPATPPAPPVQAPAPTQQRQPPPAPEAQPQRQPLPDPVQAEEAKAEQEIISHLTRAGIAPTQITGHFQTNLIPLIQTILNNEHGGIAFEKVAPAYRAGFAKRAQAEFVQKTARRTAPVADDEGPGNSPISSNGRRGPPRAARESDDYLSAVINHLSAD